MASDYPFANPLPWTSGVPDISFTCVHMDPHLIEGVERSVYASKERNKDGESLMSIQTTDRWYIVRYAGSVHFYLSSDKIIAHLLDSAYHYIVEILLLGDIFSIWLELQGIRAIHASATVVNNNTIAFLATNTGGKSALAAAFTQSGYPVLSDDLLPIESRDGHFLARSGYPAMRMWPDEAEYFLGGYKDLEIVHPVYSKRRIAVGPNDFGTFCHEEKPLGVIYIPQRLPYDCDITIEPISPKNAFFNLIQNSFMAGIVEALGLQPERMRFFTQMAMHIPMRQINYPEGFYHLPRLVDAILKDIASLDG